MEKEISDIDKKIQSAENQLKALRRQKAILEDKEKWFIVIINMTKIDGGMAPLYIGKLTVSSKHCTETFETREDADEYISKLKKENEEYNKDHYFYIADIEKPATEKLK